MILKHTSFTNANVRKATKIAFTNASTLEEKLAGYARDLSLWPEDQLAKIKIMFQSFFIGLDYEVTESDVTAFETGTFLAHRSEGSIKIEGDPKSPNEINPIQVKFSFFKKRKRAPFLMFVFFFDGTGEIFSGGHARIELN